MAGEGRFGILISSIMLDSNALLSGKPIPAVDPSDMRRIWELISEAPPPESAGVGVRGWNANLIADQCSQGADPLAVFYRAALLKPLLESGLLDNWRDGDSPHDVVFQALAAFPLPEGIQGFRPDEFIDALKKSA